MVRGESLLNNNKKNMMYYNFYEFLVLPLSGGSMKRIIKYLALPLSIGLVSTLPFNLAQAHLKDSHMGKSKMHSHHYKNAGLKASDPDKKSSARSHHGHH
jgi:hypothetical protein